MTVKTTIQQQWHGQDVKVRGKRVVGKTAFEIGLIVEGYAKSLAPVNFGHLAASITTQASDGGSEPSRPRPVANPKGEDVVSRHHLGLKIDAPTEASEVLVGTPLFYAPHVEFGTVRMDAQPFLRPALDLARGQTLTVTMKNGRYEFREYLR